MSVHTKSSIILSPAFPLIPFPLQKIALYFLKDPSAVYSYCFQVPLTFYLHSLPSLECLVLKQLPFLRTMRANLLFLNIVYKSATCINVSMTLCSFPPQHVKEFVLTLSMYNAEFDNR